MRYRTLGQTGIKVSPYALGAMMLGVSIGNPDHDDSIRIIHKALDAGINVIDTADAYSRGESEVVVGKALKGRRDGVVVATRCRSDDHRARARSRPAARSVGATSSSRCLNHHRLVRDQDERPADPTQRSALSLSQREHAPGRLLPSILSWASSGCPVATGRAQARD